MHSKHITDWSQAYRVDEEGRVYSRLIWRDIRTEHQITPICVKGYPCVRLHVASKTRLYPVHKLMALTFLAPKPSPKHIVRHLDGNPQNNRIENLAWGTHTENFADRAAHGRTSHGVRHSIAIRQGLPEYRFADPTSVALMYIDQALSIFRKAEGRL